MRYRRSSRYSPQQQKEAVDLYRSGLSLMECSKQLGISNSLIGDWCRVSGATRSQEDVIRLRADKGMDARSGENHYRWNGGLNGVGYVSVSRTRHRTEHSLVAERVLGRKLKRSEVVHHINGDKADNRNCNLMICDRSYHQQLHAKMSNLYMKEHFAK